MTNIRKILQEQHIHFNEQDTAVFPSAIFEAVKLIPDTAERVLDIGCGKGTGKLIADKVKPGIREYHGIEFHAAAVSEAKKHISYFCEADIEDFPADKYEKGYFDVLMFNDVLEHLVFPKKAFSGFLPFLKPDGAVIISIPNVLHQSVILNLLLHGLWTDGGVAVDEHLHFFTFSEMLNFLNSFNLSPNAPVTGITTNPEPSMRAILKAARPWMKYPYNNLIMETNIFQFVIRAGFNNGATNYNQEIIQVPNVLYNLADIDPDLQD